MQATHLDHLDAFLATSPPQLLVSIAMHGIILEDTEVDRGFVLQSVVCSRSIRTWSLEESDIADVWICERLEVLKCSSATAQHCVVLVHVRA